MSVDTTTRAPEAPVEEPRKIFGMTISPPKKSGGSPGKGAALVVGGAPRANLLPPEIILKRTQLKTRRGLRVGVLFVAIAVAAGCLGSVAFSTAAGVQLATASANRDALVLEQATYSEVTQVLQTIDTIKAGQQVGASTEIAWRDYLVSLQATLPAGVTLTSLTVDSATPMTAYDQPTGPLQGARVATLQFTAKSATLPSIPDWLRGLATLPGFVDATPGSVKLDADGYTSQVSMHINADAFSLRYDPATVAEREAAAAEAAGATTEGGN